MRKSISNLLKRFASSRNRVALTSFLIIGVGWQLCDFLATGPVAQWRRHLGGIIAIASLFGGIVLFFFGSRYARRKELGQQRLAFDQCAKCSFDLTGNISGTCPECGTPIRSNTA